MKHFRHDIASLDRLARTAGTRPVPRLGSGGRFRALRAKLARRGDVSDPTALAAWIGRQKYGKRKFQAMAARGRRR